MSKDSASTAPSEAPTLVDNNNSYVERTNLHGQPITQDHDNLSGVMLGDGGGFAAPGVGANLLPPGYTDKSRVRIPIKWVDVGGKPSGESASEIKTEKKGGIFGKFSSKRSESIEKEFVMVMMSRGDYLKYWAKDKNGQYLDSVVEPPEGRQEWLRQQLELNDEMKKNDPSLGKEKFSLGKYAADYVPGMTRVRRYPAI